MDSLIEQELLEPSDSFPLFDITSDSYLFDANLQPASPGLVEIGSVAGNDYDLNDIQLDPLFDAEQLYTENDILSALTNVALPIGGEQVDYSPSDTLEDLQAHHELEDISETRWFKCQVCDYKSSYKDQLDKHVAQMHAAPVPKSRAKPKRPDRDKLSPSLSQEFGGMSVESSDSHDIVGGIVDVNAANGFEFMVESGDQLVVENVEDVFTSYTIGDASDDELNQIIVSGNPERVPSLSIKSLLQNSASKARAGYKSATGGDKVVQKNRSRKHGKNPSGEKTYPCNVCDYIGTHRNNLILHKKIHTGAKPFRCKFCDFKSVQKSNLRSHMKIHSDEKPFHCEVCDYKCAWKRSLQAHMQKHTGEKALQCEICDFKCSNQTHLQAHKKIHTGEKPFCCQVCDYKSAQKSNLRSHMKTHSGEKPFHCHLCDYKCSWKRSLQSHILKHTGEKTLQCDICDFKCSHQSTLRNHINRHGLKTG